MEYRLKTEDNVYLNIAERENNSNKIESIELSIGIKKDFDDAHIFLSKTELHKLIGALLHIQAKMK
jgi:hypothetical protein